MVYLTGSSIDSRMHSLQKAKAAFEATNKDSNVGVSFTILKMGLDSTTRPRIFTRVF